MNTPDFTDAIWRKSTYSGDNGGQCVEVAFHEGFVGTRDSKAKGNGPTLAFRSAKWSAFMSGVMNGGFQQP